MHKLSHLLLPLILAVALPGLSQITVDQSDMPSAGDTIRLSTGLNIGLDNPEETGEGHYWDFSGLITIGQQVDTFVSVTQTPIFYWPFFLLSANLASPLLQDSPLPDFPLTNVYGFFNKNSNSYDDLGFAATLFGLPLPFKYDEPDVLHRFPLNYGDADSSESGFSGGIPDVGYIHVERERKNVVDGWGTLETPYGVFDVLRVRSTVKEYDSIYLDSLGIGFPVNRNYVEYKWIGKGHGLPLLTIQDDLFGLVVEFVDSVRQATSGAGEGTPELAGGIRIYPNPSSGMINIEDMNDTPDGMIVSLYGGQGGLLIPGQASRSGRITLDLTRMNLPDGVYFIMVSKGGKQFYRKIIYSK